MKYEEGKWCYSNLYALVDLVASRVKKEGLESDAQQLLKVPGAVKDIALGYWYGYAKTLPAKQVPKSISAVEQMIHFVVSYQKIDEILERHGNSMKTAAEYIIVSRARLWDEHGIQVVERSMKGKTRYLKVA